MQNINIDNLTQQQAGNFYIDEADVEEARLILSRLAGVPEPELYHDESPSTYDDNGVEEQLNKLLDLQERMAKGMSMIKECNDVLDKANNGRRLPYLVFTRWVQCRKKFWFHWWKLKNECDAIAKACPQVWPKYFQLEQEDINPYFTYGGEDQEEGVDTRMMDTADAYSLSHKEEQEELFVYSY